MMGRKTSAESTEATGELAAVEGEAALAKLPSAEARDGDGAAARSGAVPVVIPAEDWDESPLIRGLESLLPLGRSLMRRRDLFLAILVAASVVLLSGVFLQTPRFTSTAYLLVKFGRELVYRPEVADASTGNFAQRNKETMLNSELVIAQSQPVLSKVVETVGIDRLYPALHEHFEARVADLDEEQVVLERQRTRGLAVERFRQALTVQALPGSDVIRVAVEHSDPVLAADAANTVIEELTAKHLEVFGDRRFVEFLEERVDSYRVALTEAEAKLNAFQSDNQSFAVGDAQGELAERRAELKAAMLKVDEQIGEVRLKSLQKDSAYSEAEIELLQLRSEEARTTGILQRDVRQRIGIVSRFLAGRRAEARRQVEAQEAKRAELEAELAEIDEVFVSLPGLSGEHRSLLRERDAVEDQYRTYQKRLREARISYDMDREKLASIRVIQAAFPPLEPTRAVGMKVQAVAALALALLLAALGTLCVDTVEGFRHRRRTQGLA